MMDDSAGGAIARSDLVRVVMCAERDWDEEQRDEAELRDPPSRARSDTPHPR